MLAWLLIACGGAGNESEYPFEPGPDMLPGDNCRSCHKADGPYEDAPEWTVAGTVFTDASGSAGAPGVTVRVIDDEGTIIEMVTSSSGNFFTAAPVVEPYLMELEKDGVIVGMPTSPPSGGCNACHASGPIGGAPGALYVGSFASTMTCDGASTLTSNDGTTYPCDPYVCDTDTCLFACEGDEDCIDGTSCDAEGRCR